MMLTIGLTGGIGCGKTTVANLFASRNIKIIDTDLIAHELIKPNTVAYKQIIAQFGSTITTTTGEIDRPQLAHLIFSNPKLKQWLETLLHPLIWKKVTQQIQAANSRYVIIVIPLLIETQWYKRVDKVLVIDIDEDTQLTRTMKRNKTQSEQDIKRIMGSQCSRKERLTHADDIIYNDSLEHVKQQVITLDEKYSSLC